MQASFAPLTRSDQRAGLGWAAVVFLFALQIRESILLEARETNREILADTEKSIDARNVRSMA
jgi:hypothetical protein